MPSPFESNSADAERGNNARSRWNASDSADGGGSTPARETMDGERSLRVGRWSVLSRDCQESPGVVRKSGPEASFEANG
jgi:hypothetical protein